MAPDEALKWVGVFVATGKVAALLAAAVVFLICMWKDLINDR